MRKIRHPRPPPRFNALVRKTSLDPTSQRNVGACDDELADFAGRRGTTLFIDERETVAGQRIADGNAGVVTPAPVVDEPLQHRRFRGGVDQLDGGLRREPRAQRFDVAPQRRVSAHTDQPQRGFRAFSTSRNDGSQKSRKREQDGDGLRADHVQYLARADALRIEEVNACACQ